MARDALEATGITPGVTSDEIVDLARANIGIDWTIDGCTDFVWGISNLAGAPFFDLKDNTTGGDPTQPQDILYVVPHSDGIKSSTDDVAGDGWAAVYEGTSATDLAAALQPGDVVRVYASGNAAEESLSPTGGYVAHSFIVVSVEGGDIQVVDNWNTAGIIQHSLNDITSAFAPVGEFAAAFVSRLDQTYTEANFGSDLACNGYGDFSALQTLDAAGPIAVIDLAALDGTNGFRIDGVDAGDRSGYSVSSAGDVNGDGFDDVIVGAQRADVNGQADAGESYVVFGSGPGFAASLDLSTLDGTNGFRIDGIEVLNNSDSSVSSAGDVNGDGFDDFIIGAYNAEVDRQADAGESYVVFGSGSRFAASLDLAALDGTNGFRIDGIEAFQYNVISVSSAGDVNGDGFDDVIIGAYNADVDEQENTGKTYVVFGSGSGFAASLDLAALDGTNGFWIDGIDAGDWSGISVSSAGDVNGDGFDDVIIGAAGADPGGKLDAGESYVVFGSGSGFAPSLNLAALDGTNGFRINGIEVFNYSGLSVSSAGDVNGDGLDDVIIGAYRADADGQADSGEIYVVFGSGSGFAASLNLAALDGTNGFRIDGIQAIDGTEAFAYSVRSVSSAGDVNGDGFDDVILGAVSADPVGLSFAAESYVVFGMGSGFAARLDLAALNGTNGFRIAGIDAFDESGFSVSSAGDVNSDGFDDFIIGAPGADPGGKHDAGESYVVFGFATSATPEPLLPDLTAFDWDLSGIDAQANTFEGDLVFEIQDPIQAGYSLGGYFDWVANGSIEFRILFDGLLEDDGDILFTDTELAEPVPGVIAADYFADFNTDFTRLTGTSGGDGIISLNWQADRVDPASGNNAPQATGGEALLTAGTSIPLASLFAWSDPDGLDDIVSFAVRDRTDGAGYLTFDGIRQTDGVLFDEQPIENIDRWAFMSGADGESDNIGFAVTDSIGNTSDATVSYVESDEAPLEPEPTEVSQHLLEYFAKEAAYSGGLPSSGFLEGSFLSGWAVQHVFAPSGLLSADTFAAITLKHDTFGDVLAIRGSSGSKIGDDWIQNFRPGGVARDEFDAALDEIDTSGTVTLRQWLRTTEKIAITGHSQGGAQAQYAVIEAIAAGNNPRQISTFNSAGIPLSELNRVSFSDFDDIDVRHFVSHGDIVSLTGNTLVPTQSSGFVYYDFGISAEPSIGDVFGQTHQNHWVNGELYGLVTLGLKMSASDYPPASVVTVLGGPSLADFLDPDFSLLDIIGNADSEFSDALGRTLSFLRETWDLVPEALATLQDSRIALPDLLPAVGPLGSLSNASRALESATNLAGATGNTIADTIESIFDSRAVLEGLRDTVGFSLVSTLNALFDFWEFGVALHETLKSIGVATSNALVAGTKAFLSTTISIGDFLLDSIASIPENTVGAFNALTSFLDDLGGLSMVTGPIVAVDSPSFRMDLYGVEYAVVLVREPGASIDLAEGKNILIGSIRSLDDGTVREFGIDDAVFIVGEVIENDELARRKSSAILSYDKDGDGQNDFSISLSGDYRLASFETEIVENGTYIRYLGNGLPEATNDAFETTESTSFTTGNVLENDTDEDGDDLSITALDTGTTLGLVTDNENGTFDYDPNGAFDALAKGETATDTFAYFVTDGVERVRGEVTITITGLSNAAPVPQDDVYETRPNQTLTIGAATGLLANDSDPDGDALAVANVSNAVNGTVSLDAKGDADASNDEVIFTPLAGYSGPASFDYTVADGFGGEDTAMVTVDVRSVEDSDGDLVPDDADNAIFVVNPDQRDSNGDGYGNVIDADLTNDGVIDVEDLLIFRTNFGSTGFEDGVDPAADADFDGNGAVDVDDLLIFRDLFGEPLGTSFVDDLIV